MKKPIRVFYSPVSGQFYATRSYKELSPGLVEIAGAKDNVTQDIARLIVENNITFSPAERTQ
jgi:hypothetical protein